MCVYFEIVCATSLSFQLIVHECSKTHGAVEPRNLKPDAQNPTATYFGGSSLHGSIRFETFFALHSKKIPLQGMQGKIFVSGYSKDYVVPYLSLV